MKLIFGLRIEDFVFPQVEKVEGGTFYCGPQSILSILESFLGLKGHPDNIDYLRVEQYRQALLVHQAGTETSRLSDPPFYFRSFQADQFATAAELLNCRDELLLAGWDFKVTDETPDRLVTLAEVECVFGVAEDEDDTLLLSPGYADRFVEVLDKLQRRGHPFTRLVLHEPFEYLPVHFRRLFQVISETAAKPAITQILGPVFPADDISESSTDLQKIQYRLWSGYTERQPSLNHSFSLNNDGSLLIIRSKSASEAARFTARLLKENPSLRPACVIPEKNRNLEAALVLEGLPSLGMQSASLARPALQILKLATTFLWWPIDPFKILEFVSLSVKPLPDELAAQIAHQVARSPGLLGERWKSMIGRYFSELETKAPPKTVAAQRKQYRFWFERQRHNMDGKVPVREVIDIFSYLREWAYQVFEENSGKNSSLLVLSEQCKRITELLATLPERELSYLELERIVRTIYEPSPVVFQEREAGHLPFVMHPGAFIREAEEVLWWNFVEHEPNHFFSRWYPAERQYLDGRKIYPDTPELENARALWQRIRPVVMAGKRLILVVPEMIDGEEMNPHPLWGDLQATFGNLAAITLDIAGEPLSNDAFPYILPVRDEIESRQLGRPKPFIQIRNLEVLPREHETLTSLESLFYYPYQWFFRYKIKLQKSAILSVVKDHTLKGNLAHRVLEHLLQEDITAFDRPALEGWVERECRELFAREGAVLLMYGREPERVAFINTLKFASWSLVSHIRENGWKVKKTEMELEGTFPCTPSGAGMVPVRGIADLVLEREDELAVVDFKWRGASYRANVLRNREDLQLVLYSRLLAGAGQWAHTSYFIIESGKLITRSNEAFKRVVPLQPDADLDEINNEILKRMEATWKWRMDQLGNGRIEVRCRHTVGELEDTYGGGEEGNPMMEMLEMKSEDAKWDDYRTLINLVE